MYARITNFQADPDPKKIDEAIRIVQSLVLPAVQQQKGFVSYTQMIDRATGCGMSISVWQTEADLHASESNGYYREQLAKVGPYLTAPPTRAVYEVTVTG